MGLSTILFVALLFYLAWIGYKVTKYRRFGFKDFIQSFIVFVVVIVIFLVVTKYILY